MSTSPISDNSSCNCRTKVATAETIRCLFLAAGLTLLYISMIADERILFELRSSTIVTDGQDKLRRAGQLSSSSIAQADIAGFASLNHHHTGAMMKLSPDPAVMNMEMWCVLDENNTFQFKHFPHASQALLPCWSWFQRIRERVAGGSNMTCGFFVNPELEVKRWTEQLIELMGCLVSYDQPFFTNSQRTNKTMILHYDEVVGRGRNWFEKPEDAAALRSRLLHRLDVNTTTAWSRSSSMVATGAQQQQQQQTITIINRRGTRCIVNSENITNALQEAYPSALIRTMYMEDMEPMEQFAVWSQQSIVITPHGAALTNGIFLPPGNASAVIEIFPKHYFAIPFFGSLLRSCGVRRYGYYFNESNPLADWKVYGSTREQRSFYRSVNLEPPVADIVGLVRQALTEGESNIYTSF